MPDYHAMYLKLASAQTIAIEALQAATNQLITAIQEAEDVLLEAPHSETYATGHSEERSDEEYLANRISGTKDSSLPSE